MLSACALSFPAWASGPELGGNVGVAVPLKKYSHTIEGVGGTTGALMGYRFDVTDNLAFSLVATPHAFFAGTEEGCCNDKPHDDDITALLAATGGPKLTFHDERFEAYVLGQGGWYWDLNGPLSDDGPGYNIGAGINIDVGAGTASVCLDSMTWPTCLPSHVRAGASGNWYRAGSRINTSSSLRSASPKLRLRRHPHRRPLSVPRARSFSAA
jgi:hypothetical protein